MSAGLAFLTMEMQSLLFVGAVRRPRRPGFAVLPSDEVDDNDHPSAVAADTGTHIQQFIVWCVDARMVAVVREAMGNRGDVACLRRMDVLVQDRGQEHT